jgi:hypothetical protein
MDPGPQAPPEWGDALTLIVLTNHSFLAFSRERRAMLRDQMLNSPPDDALGAELESALNFAGDNLNVSRGYRARKTGRNRTISMDGAIILGPVLLDQSRIADFKS